MTFSRPLMYKPRIMGCVFGRGEMWMVIWGWAFANDAMSGERRNVLRGVELVQVGEMRGNLDE